MQIISEADRIPENTIVLSGESLTEHRHMPTPPSLETLIRGPRDPKHLFEILREEYPADHPLRLLSADGEQELVLSDLDTDEDLFGSAAYLVIPPLPESHSFETFQNTVAILRGPHGCPWDKKQTHQSLRDDFLQEVYELLDGLDRGSIETVTEELGDVLLHILLQAQIGVDNGEFTMGDVIAHINEKIIYRHEHVFGRPENISPEEIMTRWEQLKQKERAGQHKQGGLLDGISKAMPALSQASSYQRRAAKAGFDWETEEGVWQKMNEELAEFKNASTPEEREEELGDILFCVVNLARWYEIDPETALRMANLKFYERLHAVENLASAQGKNLFDLTAEEKLRLWEKAKNASRV
ncbi:MAG: nucleoside triphosphate pyrophosphohydrolase [Flexilinea sp.]|nr:nucleoside triphosphate pyrophosphohydrolase [Flexilinea sp.]